MNPLEYNENEPEGVINHVQRQETTKEKCPNCGTEMTHFGHGNRMRCNACGAETEAQAVTEPKTSIDALRMSTHDFPDDTIGKFEGPPSKEIRMDGMNGLDEALERNFREDPSLDTRPPTEIDPLSDPKMTRDRAIGLRQTDILIGNKDSGFNQNWEEMTPTEIGNALQKLSEEEYVHLLFVLESAQKNKPRDEEQMAA